VLKKIIILSLSFFMGVSCTHQRHPYSFGTYYFPENSDSKSYTYKLYIIVDGEEDHAYTEKTDKKISLSIKNHDDKILLYRNYGVIASDLNWDIHWEKVDNLHIVFYQYASDISKHEAMNLSITPQQIMSLSFSYDEQSQSLTEAPVPDFVLKKLQAEYERERKKHIVLLSFYAENGRKDIEHALHTADNIAHQYLLIKKDFTTGLSGELAHYFEKDFELTVKYYDPAVYPYKASVIEFLLEDYGREDLSDKIVSSLKERLGKDVIEEEIRPYVSD
jgi:hypothetical protein